ncbi:MAG: 2Fe-2S iron-sulfur cluster binding domain-containing protein [Anaerolineae bacterium]
MQQFHQVQIIVGADTHILQVPDGANLRRVLLEAGLSPYAPLTRSLNCGGRGLCATCGVWIDEGEQSPEHWHDQLAARFGYPRLSCQVTVKGDMVVRLLPEKVIWGKRDLSRSGRR